MLYELTAGYGIFLVLGVQVIAVAFTVVSGGFKFGDLKRAVQLTIARVELDGFWSRMRERLSELGFRQSEVPGRFLQGGKEFGNPTTFTHGKTSKELNVQSQDSGADQTTVTATLRYLDPIVGDTGESAYRDAVLEYVTGITDRMVLVPNRSLLAVHSLIGGATAVILAIFLFSFNFRQFLAGFWVLSFTEIVAGLLAIFSVLRKPGEITGIALAATGVALSGVAIAIAFLARH